MVEFSYRNTFFVLAISLVTACSPFRSKQPSIVLIMLESFSEQDFMCADSEIISSLENIKLNCEIFFRFTHVFAPTDLTQPNISSLFSQQTVQEHGVIHNGAKGLSAKVTTLAEKALAKKMRTGFFSGGIPLLPKFGITQGFETFNDGFVDKGQAGFRPFEETIEKALFWLDTEVKTHPFFLSLYVPDLLYGDRVTTGPEGQERPLNRRSQIQNLYESMERLVSGLRARKLWANSYIILVGLGGYKKKLSTHNELNSVRFRVPLQIKLPDKVTINLSELKEDLISFDLIGQWMSLFIENDVYNKGSRLPDISLGRFIPQESHWKSWLGLSNSPSYGLRTRRFLFRLSPTLKVYDSFEDRLEYHELSPEVSGPIAAQFRLKESINDYFKDNCLQDSSINKTSCTQTDININNFTTIERMSQWSESLTGNENIQFDQLVNEAIQSNDLYLIGWLAYKSLYYKKWDTLFELGKRAENQSWILVAQANLREAPNLNTSGCLKYFIGEQHETNDFYQHCQDSALRKVVEGFGQLKRKKKPSVSFWNQLDLIKKRREALDINQKMKYINDVMNPFDYSPSLAELYFFLPNNNIYQNLIDGK